MDDVNESLLVPLAPEVFGDDGGRGACLKRLDCFNDLERVPEVGGRKHERERLDWILACLFVHLEKLECSRVELALPLLETGYDGADEDDLERVVVAAYLLQDRLPHLRVGGGELGGDPRLFGGSELRESLLEQLARERVPGALRPRVERARRGSLTWEVERETEQNDNPRAKPCAILTCVEM